MLFVLQHLLFLVVHVFAARVLGGGILERLKLDRRSIDESAEASISAETAPTLAPTPAGGHLERFVLSTILGLGLVGQVVFVLGLLGFLFRGAVLGALGALVALVLVADRSTRSRLLAEARAARRAPGVAWLVGVALAVPILGLALQPPMGFDAGTYHLPFVQRFLEAGRLVFIPELRYPIFPQLAEMGFLFGFVAASDVAARLTQVPALALVAALLVAWGRRWERPLTGTAAAALWLGTPLAVWIGTSAYVDVGLAAFVAAGLFAAERALGARRAGRWWALSGAFFGFAVATKYLGLFFLGVLGLLVVAGALRRPRQRLGALAVGTTAAALAVGATAGPWIVRLVASTGNPVFPFYTPIFGENEWSTWHDAEIAASVDPGEALAGPLDVVLQQGERIVEGLGFLVAVPWTSIFERHLFGYQAPLSPWFLPLLLLAPVAWFLGRRGGRDQESGDPVDPVSKTFWHGVLVLAYGLFWLTTVRDLRFLLPVLPSLSLVLAAMIERLLGALPRPLDRPATRAAIVLALVLPGWAYAAYKLAEIGPPPTTAAAREAKLEQRVAGYSTLRAVVDDEVLVYGLHAEHLIYHGDGRLVGDWFGPYRFERVLPHVAAGNPRPRRLVADLRSMGAAYFLVRTDLPTVEVPETPCLRRIAESEHPEGDYSLYALDAGCS